MEALGWKDWYDSKRNKWNISVEIIIANLSSYDTCMEGFRNVQKGSYQVYTIEIINQRDPLILKSSEGLYTVYSNCPPISPVTSLQRLRGFAQTLCRRLPRCPRIGEYIRKQKRTRNWFPLDSGVLADIFDHTFQSETVCQSCIVCKSDTLNLGRRNGDVSAWCAS